MQALGGYLKGLREGQNLTQIDVVLELKSRLGRNVSPATISKIENGGMQTIGSDLLFALLEVLAGNPAQAWELMTRGAATRDDGENQGRKAVGAPPKPASPITPLALTSEEAAELTRLAAAASPEARARALEALRRQLEG